MVAPMVAPNGRDNRIVLGDHEGRPYVRWVEDGNLITSHIYSTLCAIRFNTFL